MILPRSHPTVPAPVEAAIALLVQAGPDLGVFSTAQAHRVGVSDEMLHSLVRWGRLVHPVRGWYHLADPGHGPLGLHRRAAIAQVRRREGRAVASHHSALIAYGIPALGADLATVHLTHRSSTSYRLGRNCVVHRADPSSSPPEVGAADSAVPVSFAIVQAGLLKGPLATLIAGDYALGRELTSADAIARAAARYRHSAGIAVVAELVPHLNGLAESPAESLAREAVRRLGYPVVAQRRVRSEGRRYRVDLAVEGTRLLIEIDGRVKYQVKYQANRVGQTQPADGDVHDDQVDPAGHDHGREGASCQSRTIELAGPAPHLAGAPHTERRTEACQRPDADRGEAARPRGLKPMPDGTARAAQSRRTCSRWSRGGFARPRAARCLSQDGQTCPQ